jgi:hypothetical protein
MNVELDVEKRLQAVVAKERVRIKEFFIDFDKLRKGQVGVSAVSNLLFVHHNHSFYSSEPVLVL